MIFCNVRIRYILQRQRRHFESQNGHVKIVNIEQTLNGSIRIKRSPSHRKAIERQMFLMMSSCVIVFLSTTVPVTIYLVLLEQVIVSYPNFARDNAYYVFIFRMLRALMYVHFGCNFYLYCLTSRIFRGEFIRTITCERIILNINQDATASLTLNKIIDVSNV
jgi:hypothetical protein